MSGIFSSPFMAKSPFHQKNKSGRGSSTGNKVRVPSKYKTGDNVSEDDLDKALKLPNKKGQTGVSGQDFSKVKMDAKGPYVIRIDDKIEE